MTRTCLPRLSPKAGSSFVGRPMSRVSPRFTAAGGVDSRRWCALCTRARAGWWWTSAWRAAERETPVDCRRGIFATLGVRAQRCWNESYASGEPPWDTGEPEPLLVEFVTSGRIRPTPTLEIDAGTGTNAIWLAERGFDVLGTDVASLAVERATARLNGRNLRCRFRTLDFLAADCRTAAFTSSSTAGAFMSSMNPRSVPVSPPRSRQRSHPAACG